MAVKVNAEFRVQISFMAENDLEAIWWLRERKKNLVRTARARPRSGYRGMVSVLESDVILTTPVVLTDEQSQTTLTEV